MRAFWRLLAGCVVLLPCAAPADPVGSGGRVQAPTGESVPSKARGNLVEFSFGEGDRRVRVTFDASAAPAKATGRRLRLEGAIVDFVFPFKGTGGGLTRSTAGGREVVNVVELHDEPRDGKTTVLFRLTTEGSGKGPGQVGVSIVAGFCLKGDVFPALGRSALRVQRKGELVASSADCRAIMEHIEPDLQVVGADSRPYVLTFAPSDSPCAFFHGFAVFDPTVPKSKRDAYFEAQTSEGGGQWRITAK